MSNKLKKELIIWLQYFFIFFIAIFVASLIREHNRALLISNSEVVNDIDVNINFNSLIQTLWNEYFYWYVVAFIALSLIRFALLSLFNQFQKKIK